MTFLVKQPEGIQWTWDDHHWTDIQSSPYRKKSNFHPLAEKTVTSSTSTTTAAPVWVWGRGMLYISACTECCVYPAPFQWPARELPLCFAVPALPWWRRALSWESLLEQEGMTQWGGSLQRGQILADACKKQKMIEPNLRRNKFFLIDPETPRVRLCKTSGSIWQLAATKSILCRFRKLRVSNKQKTHTKKKEQTTEVSRGK